MTSEPWAPRRLHRAEIVLAALDNLRELIIAAVVALVLGGGPSGLSPLLGVVVGLAGVGAVLVAGYLRWSSTTYWVAGEALHFRTGLISPDDTTVPLARINALDTSQGPVQRLFGVREMNVQTAGGGAEGEIKLRALSEASARELRVAAGLPEPTAERLPEWRIGAGRLVAAALTTPQLGVILPLMGAFGAVLDDLLVGDDSAAGLVDRLPTDPVGVVLLAVAVGGAALLVSFLGAVVAFAGFTLVRDGRRLRIRRGLVQRRAASIPLGRVHAVELVESLVRRPFGLAAVRVQTAGYRREGAAAQTLFPLVRREEVPGLLARFVPDLATELGRLERPPARARRRYALAPALVGAALGAAAALAWSWAWPAVPLLALAGAAYGLAGYAAAGWRLEHGQVITRQGAITRRTLIARADRLQEHGLSASAFQRRAGLADLALEVGSGRRGRVRHLERPVAAGLFERLAR